ncbi:TetR family transcriptional regulator [Tsukamurella sp. 8F]|uniref:TetR/AcrR family transcriptional regulator n=1 Tax=unclassified Tsukamurella TaxID=2633480 RepID=UPI0023B896D9|nr:MULTISPECIES: TetR/AcrR family transcriptional regulator [unclassified Tsukamurella]MDF0529110.1 TetR family transcriptional regulator [Tsukamurella sp. 8J]MDF0588140.1 TetR family transcriptional regulator [Tsukamurella sp. 8F]
MSRLTRAEQRARTRQELIDAARERFLQVGYGAASLEDIAEHAGYSKGAVYSNFTDKPTLCRAVLDEIHHDKIGELAALTGGELALEDRVAAAGEWLERTVGDVGWTMLELEFVTLSRGDAALTRVIAELRDDARAAVVELLRSLRTESDAAVDDEVLGQIADLLLSAGIGLGIQRAVDPTISIDPMVGALRTALALIG